MYMSTELPIFDSNDLVYLLDESQFQKFQSAVSNKPNIGPSLVKTLLWMLNLEQKLSKRGRHPRYKFGVYQDSDAVVWYQTTSGTILIADYIGNEAVSYRVHIPPYRNKIGRYHRTLLDLVRCGVTSANLKLWRNIETNPEPAEYRRYERWWNSNMVKMGYNPVRPYYMCALEQSVPNLLQKFNREVYELLDDIKSSDPEGVHSNLSSTAILDRIDTLRVEVYKTLSEAGLYTDVDYDYYDDDLDS